MANKFLNEWPGYMALIFALIGVVLGFLIRETWMRYFSAVLIGFACGGLLLKTTCRIEKLPVKLAIAGFLIGFLIGSIYSGILWVMVFFAIGCYGGYQVYKRKVFLFSES